MIIALVWWLIAGRTYSRNMLRVREIEQEEEQRDMNGVNTSAVEVVKG